VRPGAILGADRGTLPFSFLLFDRNTGDGTRGLVGVGGLSAAQIDAFGLGRPAAMARFPSGLILQDSDGDGALDPRIDQVIGGVRETAPVGARGSFATSPLARGRPLLSQPTEQLDPQVGPRVGGAVMDVAYQVGKRRGVYAVEFALLADPAAIDTSPVSAYTYYVEAR
ncbi:MAG: hypothetical protein AAF684_10390, partial [Pseudomonadota bacterium]